MSRIISSKPGDMGSITDVGGKVPELGISVNGRTAVRPPSTYTVGSMPIRSFTASRNRCLQPRYRSVVLH
jgi:hypothetical protein